jgi:hypothetical protein
MYGCQENEIANLEDVNISELNEAQVSLRSRSCASEEHTERLLQDPAYQKSRQGRLERFEEFMSKGYQKAQCSSPVLIPVAIHYQGVGSTDRSCLISLAQSQIDILNRDLAGTNSDMNQWTNQASAYFPGVSKGEACLEFVIANQNHPAGSGLANGQPAITFNQVQGDYSNTWSGYLNVFVQSNTDALGYAPLGGAGDGDGVVIDASAFGLGNGCGSISPDAPFNLGRTTTHEVGHYLLLDHIWGNGCNVDDDVSDTPDQAYENYDCPSLGISSCGTNDLHMNYMDYTNDACMYMFTAGQASRMEAYAASNLGNLIANASTVYNGSGGGDSGGGGDPTPDPEPEPDPEPVSCVSPMSADVDVISSSRVYVDWEDIPNATRYRIRYKISGTSQWTVKGSINSHKTLSSLTPGAEYVYQLRTKCPDGWQSWSSSLSFNTGGTQEPPPPTDQSYKVVVTLDDYGSETTWYIVDEQYNDVAKGGPYSDYASGTIKTHEVDLSDGCYDLEIYDDWGDGMCCDYGNGSIVILNPAGEEIASSNGRFGYFDYISFCIDNGRARITRTESGPIDSSRKGKQKITLK